MRRRTILEVVAAGGLVSVGAMAIDGTDREVQMRQTDLDALHVVQGDEVVRTVESPTDEELRRLAGTLRHDESVVTPDGECWTYCQEDCYTMCPDVENVCRYECSCILGCSGCCGAGSTTPGWYD